MKQILELSEGQCLWITWLSLFHGDEGRKTQQRMAAKRWHSVNCDCLLWGRQEGNWLPHLQQPLTINLLGSEEWMPRKAPILKQLIPRQPAHAPYVTPPGPAVPLTFYTVRGQGVEEPSFQGWGHPPSKRHPQAPFCCIASHHKREKRMKHQKEGNLTAFHFFPMVWALLWP